MCRFSRSEQTWKGTHIPVHSYSHRPSEALIKPCEHYGRKLLRETCTNTDRNMREKKSLHQRSCRLDWLTGSHGVPSVQFPYSKIVISWSCNLQPTLIDMSSPPRETMTWMGGRLLLFSWVSIVALIAFYKKREKRSLWESFSSSSITITSCLS